MNLLPAQIIKNKRNGKAINHDELQFLIEGYTNNDIPDYQMSAFLMAIYFQGMSSNETARLTKIMKESGKTFDFKHLQPAVIDKHSTGGVGDKSSLILAPIAAACEVYVPMIAGRGLGHTGGTLDKLESIPGFSTQLSTTQFESLVKEHGFAIMGQTKEICPADKKLYALRDVTATVESLPLICGSIMSKKLSEGINGLVLDVKFGRGAFMKSKEDAIALAQLLKQTGESNEVQVHALITNMEQPLGRYVGNALEMKECYEILKNSDDPLYSDTKELSLQLAAHMVLLAGKTTDFDQAYQLCANKLKDGSALEKLEKLCLKQGASVALSDIPLASETTNITATSNGYISEFLNEEIGYLGVRLKAGRAKSTDDIDPLIGFEFLKKMGHPVKSGDVLARIHHHKSTNIESAKKELTSYIKVNSQKPEAQPLIHEKFL